MQNQDVQFDADIATRLVQRAIDDALRVESIHRMHGGMIFQVFELTTNSTPQKIVAKVGRTDQQETLQRERAILDWYRTNTKLPVPRVYSVVQPLDGFTGSVLLMEKFDGVNLADAQISDRGHQHLQIELAQHVVELHTHQRERFGSALDDTGFERWADMFRPMMQREFDAVGDLLTSANRSFIRQLIGSLDKLLPSEVKPSLCHGDLWATNILVDDRHSDRPHILGFVDCAANFCDPEYEIAYLHLLQTTRGAFDKYYHRHFPKRKGYENRFRVYWLNTLLGHLRIFGDQYLSKCNELARAMRKDY